MSVVKMKPPARPPSRTWLGFAISFAIWALAGNSGAQAQTSNAMVFPREAAGLPIIPLPDLIYQALPKSDQESFGWDHLVDAPVLWLTDGIESNGTSARRLAIARISTGGLTPTVLRARKEELAWTVSMETDLNPKFGPQKIEITAGVEKSECFGVLYENCAFDERDAFSSPRLRSTVVCRQTLGGFPLVVHRVTAADKGSAFVRVWTSGGSGGVSTSVTISQSPMDCSY